LFNLIKAVCMEKYFNIVISGIVFCIEPEGYEPLRTHLESFYEMGRKMHDPVNFITEAELRLAEFIIGLLQNGKQCISSQDVHHIITSSDKYLEYS